MTAPKTSRLIRRVLTSSALTLALAPRTGAQPPVPPTPLTLDVVLARHAAAVGPLDRVTSRRTTLVMTGLAPF